MNFSSTPVTITLNEGRVVRHDGKDWTVGVGGSRGHWVKVEGKDLGQSVCDPAGENAGPQRPGVYGLLRTNYKTEVGIFRVDKLAGKIWQCFPSNNKTVCSPPPP